MPDILGLVGAAAAAVDWYRRAVLCWARAPVDRREDVERIWRAQHVAAYLQESDMVEGVCRGPRGVEEMGVGAW